MTLIRSVEGLNKISLTYKTPLHILNARKSKALSTKKTIYVTSITH
jgi:hypothetical protein